MFLVNDDTIVIGINYIFLYLCTFLQFLGLLIQANPLHLQQEINLDIDIFNLVFP